MSDPVYVTAQITKHGMRSSYNRGCRCDECREAVRIAKRINDAKRKQHPEDTPHGTRGGYCNWGCRCELCKKAHLEYMAAYRKGRK